MTLVVHLTLPCGTVGSCDIVEVMRLARGVCRTHKFGYLCTYVHTYIQGKSISLQNSTSGLPCHTVRFTVRITNQSVVAGSHLCDTHNHI